MLKKITIYGMVLLFVLMLACSDTTEPEKVVPTPTFNPPGTIYTSVQLVTISCELEEVTIRFTLNGSDPTVSSPEYTEPVEINRTTILKARAFKDGWSNSEVLTARYIIPEMVLVPGGTFTMGDTRGQGYDDESPTHQVTLSDYLIGNYPVTQLEWFEEMGSNPSALSGQMEHPAENINWYATLVYCNQRSLRENLTPAYTINGSTSPADWGAIPESNSADWNNVTVDMQADGYRLATEAEWEFAARGGSAAPDYLFSGSNNIDDVAWYSGNANDSTQPVGLKAPNFLNIYDMSGNVYEWVWDWRALYNDEAKVNPTGPAAGTMRVERGGSYTQLATRARVTHRNHSFPRHGNHHRGFRLVRTVQLPQ